jgi:uncharacterized protein (DUF342 family)
MKAVTDDIRRSSVLETYEDDLKVEGTVRSGARLCVVGDLTVRGDIEDAHVEAGGSVVIKGGFIGTGRGKVACGGTFSAAFVQGQRVEAAGDVEIGNAVVSGTIFSRGDVRMGSEGEGAIVGGAVHALGNVEASVLGSRRPVQTRIEVGVDPMLALRIDALEREAMELTKRKIGFLKDMATMANRPGSGADEGPVLDMKTAVDAIEAHIVAAGEEIIEARRTTSLNKRAVVSVSVASYPPLEISICFSRLLSDSTTGPVVFKLVEDRVVCGKWDRR